MASKRTEKAKRVPAKGKQTKATVSEAKAPKVTISTSGRHPRARVTAHGGKAELAKSLAPSIARGDEDTDQIARRLATASNQQLLRLQRAAARLKDKWGSREKLIAAIGTAQNKSKDKDFLAKLDRYSLPQLLDLATASERRART